MAAARGHGNPLHFVDTILADLRYGLRRLLRNPAFAGVTIATLGLGIGSATAMLSVAGPVLVQTLPFPGADRIRAIWDQTSDGERAAIAFGTFLELQQRSRTFESMAVAREWQPTLTGGSLPERFEGQGVSHEYFRVFGLAPRMGRDFLASDDMPNAPPVVILSDRLWRRRFNAAPDIIGTQVTLDSYGYEVIGVMPAAYEHRLMPAVDVWRALQYDRTLPSLQGREWGHHLRMFARLRDGVAQEEAVLELAQIARTPMQQIARPPWAAMPHGVTVQSLHADLTRDARPAMLAVLTAAAVLLLIASMNVVNLLLGRDAQRRAEFVMRTALGAGPGAPDPATAHREPVTGGTRRCGGHRRGARVHRRVGVGRTGRHAAGHHCVDRRAGLHRGVHHDRDRRPRRRSRSCALAPRSERRAARLVAGRLVPSCDAPRAGGG